MNETGELLRALLKNPLGVGAFAPSSKELAELMVSDITATSESVVLELGVGTGAITSAIAKKIACPDSYLGIEIDSKLAKIVKSRFPELHIINADASEAGSQHRKLGLGKIGYVLSTLPFVSLPKNVTKRILDEVDVFLRDGSMFRTFQYLHGYYTPPAKRFRKLMTERYGQMEKSPVVLKNLPPAVILTWNSQDLRSRN